MDTPLCFKLKKKTREKQTMTTINYNSLDKNNNNKQDMNPMHSPKNFRSVPRTVRSIIHKALVYRRGAGLGMREGWIGSLGLADANYYIQNGKQASHIAQRTTFNILRETIMEANILKKNMCVCTAEIYTAL